MTVTLWGTAAESTGQEIADAVSAGQHPVVAVSQCRVSSYNGVSVSTLMRSKVLVNPSDLPEATVLTNWYAASGHAQTTTAVGEGMATALK